MSWIRECRDELYDVFVSELDSRHDLIQLKEENKVLEEVSSTSLAETMEYLCILGQSKFTTGMCSTKKGNTLKTHHVKNDWFLFTTSPTKTK